MENTKSVLETVLSQLPGGIVLDVATGGGNFASIMEFNLNSCNHIVAIDVAINPIKQMKNKPNSEIILPLVMSGEQLAFQDNSFNTVSLSNSLHHLNNPANVLKEMKRTLIPGGYVIIHEMFSDGDQTSAQKTHTLLHNWWAATDSRNGVIHNPVYTEKQLRDIVLNMGLNNQQFYISENLSANPFAPEVVEFLDKAYKTYNQRADGDKKLKQQGEEAKAHLQKYGFTGARSLLAIGRSSIN